MYICIFCARTKNKHRTHREPKIIPGDLEFHKEYLLVLTFFLWTLSKWPINPTRIESLHWNIPVVAWRLQCPDPWGLHPTGVGQNCLREIEELLGRAKDRGEEHGNDKIIWLFSWKLMNLLGAKGLTDSWASVGRPGNVSTCRLEYLPVSFAMNDKQSIFSDLAPILTISWWTSPSSRTGPASVLTI